MNVLGFKLQEVYFTPIGSSRVSLHSKYQFTSVFYIAVSLISKITIRTMNRNRKYIRSWMMGCTAFSWHNKLWWVTFSQLSAYISYTSICMSTRVCSDLCDCICVCMWACMCVCFCECTCVRECECTCICECLQRSEVNSAVIPLVFAAVVVVIFICWVLFCLVFERISVISLENANSNRMGVYKVRGRNPFYFFPSQCKDYK